MQQNLFSREDLYETINSFFALSEGLDRLDYQTWGNSLKELMEFCENHPIMRHITEPLYSSEVGLNLVFDERYRPRDIADVLLPDSPDERLAFIYQLLLRMGSRIIALGDSALAEQDVYRSVINKVHCRFVSVMVGEIKGRLQRLRSRIAHKDRICISDMDIFRNSNVD